jgi:hypothetical protein
LCEHYSQPKSTYFNQIHCEANDLGRISDRRLHVLSLQPILAGCPFGLRPEPKRERSHATALLHDGPASGARPPARAGARPAHGRQHPEPTRRFRCQIHLFHEMNRSALTDSRPQSRPPAQSPDLWWRYSGRERASLQINEAHL